MSTQVAANAVASSVYTWHKRLFKEVAMQISGHKTASMLWRYNITDARDIKEAGKRMEKYLKKQKEARTCGMNYGVFCDDCS